MRAIVGWWARRSCAGCASWATRGSSRRTGRRWICSIRPRSGPSSPRTASTRSYLAAAKVGGIHANNTYPAEFIHENLLIQSNLIHAAHTSDVDRLLFLGSSCIYPKHAEQPMRGTRC